MHGTISVYKCVCVCVCRVPVCKLTAVCCKDLSAALAVCALRVLDLRGNSLTDEGLTLLCNALKSQQCKLQELR